MSISKMYHKDVSYKLALDTLAEEYIAFLEANGAEIPLYHMSHTLAVTMGLATGLVHEDLTKKVNELSKAA